MDKSQYFNIEKEFKKYLRKIDRRFMYDKCREYGVRICKDDDIPVLCYKYIRKKNKMQPWEYPDDENGIAAWVNPDKMIEDECALYISLKWINSNNKKIVSDKSVRNFEEKIKENIRFVKKCEEYMNL